MQQIRFDVCVKPMPENGGDVGLMLLELVQTLIEVRLTLRAQGIASDGEERIRLRLAALTGIEETLERVRLYRVLPADVDFVAPAMRGESHCHNDGEAGRNTDD